MLKILDYVIVVSLFIGIAIAVDYLGWPTIKEKSPWGSSLPLTYLLLFYFIVRIKKVFYSKNFNYIFFIGAFLIVSLFRLLIGESSGFYKILATLITPMMAMFWAFDMSKSGNKENVRQLFLVLFCAAILIAIYEKLSHTLIFPYSHFNPYDLNGTITGEYMRSNSVWGHPLSNAFCVGVIMMFVLVSDMKTLYKWILYVGGYVALFCFGARGVVFLTTVFTVLFFFTASIGNNKLILKNILFFSFVFLVLCYLILYLGIADRIINQKADVDDSSTYQRVEAFQYLMNLDSSSLFRGMGRDDFMQTHDSIENWILIFAMDYGIIQTVFFVFFIFYISYCGLKEYILWQKVFLFCFFISVSFINNSLAIASSGFPIFFLCCVIFSPQKIAKLHRPVRLKKVTAD